MIPVPIIESIELEADGRATVWIKYSVGLGGTLFEPIDRYRMAEKNGWPDSTRLVEVEQ